MKYKVFRTLQVVSTLVTIAVLCLLWLNVLASSDLLAYVLLASIFLLVLSSVLSKRYYEDYLLEKSEESKKKNFLSKFFFKPVIPQNKTEKILVNLILVFEILLWGCVLLFALGIDDDKTIPETIIFFSLSAAAYLIIFVIRLIARNK